MGSNILGDFFVAQARDNISSLSSNYSSLFFFLEGLQAPKMYLVGKIAPLDRKLAVAKSVNIFHQN